ncbi:MAG TPA: Ig-like domain-containing protein [Candidatus Bathyarchaeia archaeon]|nr:Ig-like domain-containing protein [Candidatus Bathyarchaeia archaeon]
MKSRKALSILFLCLAVLWGAIGTGYTEVHAADEISSLVLNKNELSMEVGDTQQLTATAVYKSGITETVTVKTEWNSGAVSVATVYAGLVTAKAEGTAVVTATYMGQSVIVNVNVSKKVKALTKDTQELDLRLKQSQQVNITAVYEDGTSEDVTKKASWSSDNSAVATVTNGLITGYSSGTATVTAKYGTQTTSIPVSIEIVKRLDPGKSSVSLLTGGSETITLIATYPDGKTEDVAAKAEWKTDSPKVADAINGKITGYGPGTATITASYGTKTTTVRVEVDNTLKLTLDQESLFMKKGETKQVTLTATYTDDTTTDVSKQATWTSSDTSVVSVYQGKLSANAIGEATITATYGDKSVKLDVDVEVPKRIEFVEDYVSLKTGDSEELTLKAVYADNTTSDITHKAKWTSADEAVATVIDGKVTAVKSGETTITASYGGKSATIEVEVDIPNKLVPSKTSLSMQTGDSEQIILTAVFRDGREEKVTDVAVWSSASAAVAEVRKGYVTGIGTGSTTITAKYGIRTATIKVSVGVLKSLTADKTQVVMSKGNAQTIKLTAKYEDGTEKDVANEATWTSSNLQVVTVEDGKITALASGTANVTATFEQKTVKIEVHVDQASTLTASPLFLVLSPEESKQITLTATTATGGTKDVTSEAEWSVSNIRLANVTNGLVTPIGTGKVTVTAKYGGKSVSISVEIGVVEDIAADKRYVAFRTGQTANLKIMATLSDGKKIDVTKLATWKTLNYKIVDVDGGVLTATGSGDSRVTATYGGKTISIPVEVDTLKYLKTDDVMVELTVGSSTSVKAFATYTDGYEAEVTKPALWTSSSIYIADVKDGVIKATGKGRATISVTFAGKRTTILVTVK